jgi:signal transduction histidine kinase
MIAPAWYGDHGGAGQRAAALAVVQMHLLLAIILLLRVLADTDALGLSSGARRVAAAFALYSAAVYLVSRKGLPAPLERALLLAEIAWFSAFVQVSGGGHSLLFPFYVFSIMIAAFRFGHADGIRAAVAAAMLYVAASVVQSVPADLPRIAMRAGFLLSLGALMASLGEANLRRHRALALLRDVAGFANPRFGIDRTVADIMERCRHHYGAEHCLLVARRARSRRAELRMSGAASHRLPPDSPLCRLDGAGILLYQRSPLWRCGVAARVLRFDQGLGWQACGDAAIVGAAAQVAALCEARSFISVPVTFRGGAARVTVCAARRNLDRTDALLLDQIVAQVLPSIENVYLLDRLASLAALRERRNIGHDLHDSAVQPYIGLNATLAALQRKCDAANPLRADLEELAAMSAQVVDDLRQFAGRFRRGGGSAGVALDAPLRRQLLRARQWYGVDIRLALHGVDGIGDRLAGAVLQLAQEGISNICKHTEARRASMCIDCDGAGVRLRIENDCPAPPPPFTPRSIAARADALGGTTTVERRAGATVVLVEIPA